jgi:hypothetical protein
MVVVRSRVLAAFGTLVCVLVFGGVLVLAGTVGAGGAWARDAQPALVTLIKPRVRTLPAQNVTRTTAVLSGEVKPKGVATSYYYAYAEESAYEKAVEEGLSNPYVYGKATPEVSIGSGTSFTPTTPLEVTSLAPGTVYHYAVVAVTTQVISPTVTEHLVVIGPDVTFTTLPPIPPIISGASASGVTQSAATVAATVDGRGLPTRWELRLGTSPGGLEDKAAGHSEGSVEPVTVELEQLVPGTVYYYEVVALNPDGTGESPEGRFTTAPGPPPPSLPPVITTPLLALPNVQFPKEEAETSTGKHKVLRACQHKHSHGKRTACERQARGRHGSKRGK